jgi:hypothetical protein
LSRVRFWDDFVCVGLTFTNIYIEAATKIYNKGTKRVENEPCDTKNCPKMSPWGPTGLKMSPYDTIRVPKGSKTSPVAPRIAPKCNKKGSKKPCGTLVVPLLYVFYLFFTKTLRNLKVFSTFLSAFYQWVVRHRCILIVIFYIFLLYFNAFYNIFCDLLFFLHHGGVCVCIAKYRMSLRFLCKKQICFCIFLHG